MAEGICPECGRLMNLQYRGMCQACYKRRLYHGLDLPDSKNIGPEEWLQRMDRPTSGCWEWPGPTFHNGYGRAGAKRGAHRWVYEREVGPIPKGLTIDHLCFNRRCVRPDHLEPVSQAENNRRATARITECPQGHEYTDESSRRGPNGARYCLICKKEQSRAGYLRKKRAA